MKKKHYIINLILFIFSFFLIESVNASSTCTYHNGKIGIQFTINNTMVTATGIYSNSKIVSYPNDYKIFMKSSGVIECPQEIYAKISEQDTNGTIGYSYTFTNSQTYPYSISLKSTNLESSCTYDNGTIGIKYYIKDKKVSYTNIYSNYKVIKATKNYEDFVDSNGKVRCPSNLRYQISEPDSYNTTGYSFTFEDNSLYPYSIGIKNSQMGNDQKTSSNNDNNSANNNNKPNANSESKPDKGTTSISTGTNCNALFGDKNDNRSIAYWLQWGLDLMKYIAIIALLALSTIDFIKALVADDKDAIKKASMTTAKRFVFAVLIFFLPIVVEMLMNLFGAYGTCDIG